MASSLLLPHLSLQIPASSQNPYHYLPISSPTLSLRRATRLRSAPLFLASPLCKNVAPFSSDFIRNVAVSSEFDQGEDVSEMGEELSFSPDLKVFVGNLPFNVDSSALAQLFERAGNVEMVEVIYDKLTGRSRGFGFVTMSTVEEAEAAAQQFNGYELDGRPLRVNCGPPPPREESRGFRRGGATGSNFGTHRVHVGNLPWGVDNSTLETLFSEQGNVVEARVVYDRESGRSRGFGFVTYNSAEEVSSAISSLDGVDLQGRTIRVTMAEARRRGQF